MAVRHLQEVRGGSGLISRDDVWSPSEVGVEYLTEAAPSTSDGVDDTAWVYGLFMQGIAESLSQER